MKGGDRMPEINGRDWNDHGKWVVIESGCVNEISDEYSHFFNTLREAKEYIESQVWNWHASDCGTYAIFKLHSYAKLTTTMEMRGIK